MAKDWQLATELKYASPPHPWKAPAWRDKVGKGLRQGGERVHCGATFLVGCSDAAYVGPVDGRKVPTGICDRVGVVDFGGPMPYSATDIQIHWKIAVGGLGGEVYALSEMAGHMLLLEDFFGPLGGMVPGVAGLEDWESLRTRLKKEDDRREFPGVPFFEHPTALGRR